MPDETLLTINAHIFYINPETNKSWVPFTDSSVPVSLFFDSNKNIYRIIALERQKIVLNSRITLGINFIKTSQKFGQWKDMKANVIFGLGFEAESDLEKFVEQFDELKETLMVTMTESERVRDFRDNEKDVFDPEVRKVIAKPDQHLNDDNSFHEQTLEEENRNLKLALKQSIANTSLIELELENVKEKNRYLSSSLEERTHSIDKLKCRLDFYADESNQLKLKLKDAENIGKQQMNKELIDEIELLRLQINSWTKEVERKDEIIQSLRETVEKHAASKDKESVARLQAALNRLQTEHESYKEMSMDKMEKLQELNSQLGNKLSEMQEIQEELTTKI